MPACSCLLATFSCLAEKYDLHVLKPQLALFRETDTDEVSLPRCKWCFRLVRANVQSVRSPIPSTQIWVVTLQYGISLLVPQAGAGICTTVVLFNIEVNIIS